jgi:hypothetical protein
MGATHAFERAPISSTFEPSALELNSKKARASDGGGNVNLTGCSMENQCGGSETTRSEVRIPSRRWFSRGLIRRRVLIALQQASASVCNNARVPGEQRDLGLKNGMPGK